MMLLKSFFRKRTIKNYFIIFLLTFTLIFTSCFLKRFYIDKQNELYKTSYIWFYTNDINIKEIKHENIKDVVVGLWLDRYTFVKSSQLSGDEIIVPSEKTFPTAEEIYHINDNFSLEEYNLNLRIIEKNEFDDLYYISENNFEKLNNSNMEKIYIVTLKSYLPENQKVTEDFLQDKFNIILGFKNNAQGRRDYLGRINMINLFVIICVIFFSIVFVITLINIVVDEQKTNKLYYVIGYNKVRIFLILISKVITLLILPLIVSLGISFIFINLFKIFM